MTLIYRQHESHEKIAKIHKVGGEQGKYTYILETKDGLYYTGTNIFGGEDVEYPTYFYESVKQVYAGYKFFVLVTHDGKIVYHGVNVISYGDYCHMKVLDLPCKANYVYTSNGYMMVNSEHGYYIMTRGSGVFEPLKFNGYIKRVIPLNEKCLLQCNNGLFFVNITIQGYDISKYETDIEAIRFIGYQGCYAYIIGGDAMLVTDGCITTTINKKVIGFNCVEDKVFLCIDDKVYMTDGPSRGNLIMRVINGLVAKSA
jgi:hypothetical protein